MHISFRIFSLTRCLVGWFAVRRSCGRTPDVRKLRRRPLTFECPYDAYRLDATLTTRFMRVPRRTLVRYGRAVVDDNVRRQRLRVHDTCVHIGNGLSSSRLGPFFFFFVFVVVVLLPLIFQRGRKFPRRRKTGRRSFAPDGV